MNKLKPDRQITILSLLVEGNSIRSIERITGTHRDTVMRLLVRAGEHCSDLVDEKMQGLRCESLQLDEIWGYVGKKEKRLVPGDPGEYGDAYTFVAMDRNTKIVPCWTVGKRSPEATDRFLEKLAPRIAGRVQVFTDGWGPYKGGVPRHFGERADFMQVVKSYGAEPDEHRYSPPVVRRVEHVWIQGFPDAALVSTSHIERQNLTMRMQIRRLTRLTNAFSKKLDNFKAAIALHFAWYNFVRIHRSLRITPAMAAGVTGSVWKISDLVP